MEESAKSAPHRILKMENSMSTHQHKVNDTIDHRKVEGEENNDRLSGKQKNDANKRISHDGDEAQIFKLEFRPQLVIPGLLTQLLGFLLQDSWAVGLFQSKENEDLHKRSENGDGKEAPLPRRFLDNPSSKQGSEGRSKQRR